MWQNKNPLKAIDVVPFVRLSLWVQLQAAHRAQWQQHCSVFRYTAALLPGILSDYARPEVVATWVYVLRDRSYLRLAVSKTKIVF